MPMMNRMLNGIYPPEPESMSDLTRTLIGIQMRREEKARQAKLDALFEERQRQMMQMAQDEQALKIAEIQQRATAATPEAQLPTVPKITSEGAFLNPDEAAYAGVEAPSSGFVKTGEMTSDVPDVSPLTVNLSGGRSVRIPQQSLEGTRSIEQQNFMAKLPEMRAESIIRGGVTSAPGTEFGVEPASVAAAKARGTQGKTVERTVNLGNRTEYIYTDGTREMKPNGPSPRALPDPMAIAAWVSDLDSGARIMSEVPADIRSQVQKAARAAGVVPAARRASEKTLGELSDAQNLILQTRDLAGYDTGVEEWAGASAPKWITQFTGWGAAEKSNRSALFLYAANTLKSVQGSRPSDKDMEWYMKNLPNIDDPPEVKRRRMAVIEKDLVRRYNNRVKNLRANGFALSGFEQEMPTLGTPESTNPPGGVQNPQATTSPGTGRSVGGFIIEKVQ